MVLLCEFQYNPTIFRALTISNCLDFIKGLLVCVKWCSCYFSLLRIFCLFLLSLQMRSTFQVLGSLWNPNRLSRLTDFPSSGLGTFITYSMHVVHIPHMFFIYYLFTNIYWELRIARHCAQPWGCRCCFTYIYAIFSQLSNTVVKVFISPLMLSTASDIVQHSVVDGLWIQWAAALRDHTTITMRRRLTHFVEWIAQILSDNDNPQDHGDLMITTKESLRSSQSPKTELETDKLNKVIQCHGGGLQSNTGVQR